MGPQEFASLTRSRWPWCSIWGSTCREPLLWGRLPLQWAIWGLSRSLRTPVENEFSFSEKWLSYLLSEAPVQRWVCRAPTCVAGTTQASGFRFLLLLPFRPNPCSFPSLPDWLSFFPFHPYPSFSPNVRASLKSPSIPRPLKGPHPTLQSARRTQVRVFTLETSFYSLFSLRPFTAAPTWALTQILSKLTSLSLLTLTGPNSVGVIDVWIDFLRPRTQLFPRFHHLLMASFPNIELERRLFLAK